MNVSESGLTDLIGEEGEVLRAYKDVVGVWTIGVGLTAASGVVKPKAGMVITREESRRLLKLALAKNYEPQTAKAMGPCDQHVFDGATSFHFNTGAIGRASWVGLWKAGREQAARNSFLQWNKGGGRVISGLTKRRYREWETITLARYHFSKSKTPGIETALQRGMTGPRVSELQELLVGVGYPIAIDGVFGQQTYDALTWFQRAHPQLTVDGIAGRATLAQLERVRKAKSEIKTTGAAGAGASGAASGGVAVTEPGLAFEWVFAAGAALTLVALVFLAWKWRDEILAMIKKGSR